MTYIEKITDKLIQNEYIPEEDREIYEYGFDIIIYTIWSTLVLLFIGFALNQFWNAVIIILCFYVFQSFGGGYHANSHIKCLLTMICGLLIGLSFAYLKDHFITLTIIICLSSVVLFLIPLTIHPNKSFLEPKRKSLTTKSIIATFSGVVLVILISIISVKILCPFTAGFFLSAVSRIAGKILYSKKASNKYTDINNCH